MNKRVIAVTFVWLATAASGVGAAEMRFPNLYAYYVALFQKGEPYLHCDYTTKTCMRGTRQGYNIVGEIVAEDRETVLRHVRCTDTHCLDFDRGVIINSSSGIEHPMMQKEDVPWSCVEAMRERRQECPYAK